MSPELISILVLGLMFLVATLLPVNMGAIAFTAAFVVGGYVAHMSSDDILGGFPGDLFLTLAGITYLFAIAQANGTVDWLVRLAVTAVRGRIAAIPWVMFGIAAVLTAIGAVSPGAVAIIAPIALGFAAKYRINPLLMGLMVVHGAQAGGFSPISIYGGIVNGVVEKSGLPGNETAIFLSSLAFNTLVAIVIFGLFGGRELLRRTEGVAPATGGGTSSGGGTASGGHGGLATLTEAEPSVAAAESGRPTRDQILTVLGLLGLAIGALAFELEVGFVAITVAVVLAVLSPKIQKGAVEKISWSTILLITGVTTYIGVLEEMGTIDYVGTSVAGIDMALLAALLLCFVGAIVSAFASSVAVLGATIPLAVPFLMQGEIGAVGMVAALAVSSTVVDCSPFSTNGALVLANAQGVDKDVFFRKLLAYGGVVVVVAPLATWLLLIVPGWL
ncbi:MAG: SLC13 family permease [Actinomadura sp.]